MAKRSVGRPYTGPLAEPIYEPVKPKIGMLADEFGGDPAKAAMRRAIARQRAKFPALFRHYKIKPGDWATLACVLAINHVPGFKIHFENLLKPGRQKRWTASYNDKLVAAVAVNRRKSPGMPIKDAVAKLINERPLEWTDTLQNLVARYYEARKMVESRPRYPTLVEYAEKMNKRSAQRIKAKLKSTKSHSS